MDVTSLLIAQEISDKTWPGYDERTDGSPPHRPWPRPDDPRPRVHTDIDDAAVGEGGLRFGYSEGKPQLEASGVNHGNERDKSGLVVRKAVLARARPIKSVWENRILIGYLNLLIGEEGLGKGTLAAWIGARITRGELPGALAGKPRPVAYVGDEDSWDHIWVPRLEAAGADLDLCEQIVAGEDEDQFDVYRDAEGLAKYVAQHRNGLVYFDQLLENLGAADSWKSQQVRKALAPLRRVADDTQTAFLCTMHPNKRAGSFRDRINGTPAFNELSRSSLLLARHPSDRDRRVCVRAKGNYTAEPKAFEFDIESTVVQIDTGIRRRGKQRVHRLTPTRICDVSESGLREDDIMGQKADREHPDSHAAQARRALKELFADGQPRPLKQLVEDLDLPQNVISAAASRVGLKKWQEGFQGAWIYGPKRPLIKVTSNGKPLRKRSQ